MDMYWYGPTGIMDILVSRAHTLVCLSRAGHGARARRAGRRVAWRRGTHSHGTHGVSPLTHSSHAACTASVSASPSASTTGGRTHTTHRQLDTRTRHTRHPSDSIRVRTRGGPLYMDMDMDMAMRTHV
jgi:hypothetical protein